MYWSRASVPGHGLLPLTCVSIESWWTGSMRSLLGMDQMQGRWIERTDCTSAESHSGCCMSVLKTQSEWVGKVWGGWTDRKRGGTGRSAQNVSICCTGWHKKGQVGPLLHLL